MAAREGSGTGRSAPFAALVALLAAAIAWPLLRGRYATAPEQDDGATPVSAARGVELGD